MVTVEWNSLRVGDAVEVHDATSPAMTLVPGVVAIVQIIKGSNDIAVRVTATDGTQTVVRPARLAVHLHPRNVAEPCWRCDDIAKALAAA